MKFYLGTHKPNWLGIHIPLFVSRRRLMDRRTFPRASVGWALDSGAFSEVSQFGKWVTTPNEYAADVDHFADQVGMLEWVAPQDWMCEPFVLKETGLSIGEHQQRTIESVLTLRGKTDQHVIPVLQGWKFEDYLEHIGMYVSAGIQLSEEPVVGLGSVCRRQHTSEIHALIRELHGYGIKLHGFGIKLKGLPKIASNLVSADSLSWSFQARHSPPIEGHEVRHKNCANCLTYALRWYDRVQEMIAA